MDWNGPFHWEQGSKEILFFQSNEKNCTTRCVVHAKAADWAMQALFTHSELC